MNKSSTMFYCDDKFEVVAAALNTRGWKRDTATNDSVHRNCAIIWTNLVRKLY